MKSSPRWQRCAAGSESPRHLARPGCGRCAVRRNRRHGWVTSRLLAPHQRVDVCYDTAADNLAALATLLQCWRAYPLDIESGLPFVIDARALHSAESLTLTTTEGNLDIFARVAGIGRYPDAVAASRVFDLDSASVPTLTLDALITSKVAAGRPKDREHVLELEALRDLAAQRGTEP